MPTLRRCSPGLWSRLNVIKPHRFVFIDPNPISVTGVHEELIEGNTLGEIDWDHPGIHRGNLITCAGSERVTDRVCSIK